MEKHEPHEKTKMLISNIFFEEKIYARQQKDSKTINAYIEALRASAEFPPILVQRVHYFDGNEKTICLDGIHRIEAYKKFGEKQVQIRQYKDEILDFETNWIELRLASTAANSTHGLKGNNEDNKATARFIAESDPKAKWSEEAIAKPMGVTQQTVNNWIKDIRARQQAGRDNLVYRLNRLGWTQEEIAKVDGRSQNRISEIIGNTNFCKIDNSLKAGKTVNEIAQYEGLDEALVWSIILNNKSDKKRMDELNENIRYFTVWNYNNANDLMGHSEFKGRMPGQITLNTLYWFTKPDDLIIDPMAGSGTTLDACLLMGRRCYAYDKNPFEKRKDILKNDITEGFPNKKPDFIFVNPPYWTMIDYNDEGISLEQFYCLLKKLAEESYKILKSGKRIAVLMANQSAKSFLPEGVNRFDHIRKEYEFFESVGFKKEWGIYCPMPTQRANRWAEKEWENHRLAEITRELTIWKK